MKSNTDLIAILACSFLAGVLWFEPVFWQMTAPDAGFAQALLDVFFRDNTPEYMLGAGIDQLGTFWIFDNATDVLLGKPSFLENIFFPVGWDLGKHTGYAWLDGLLSSPLQWALGTPAFYNLHVFLTLFGTFLGLALLFRSTTLPTILCVSLAALGLFHPFAYEEIGMGRPTQMYWLFCCLFLKQVHELSDGQRPYQSVIWTGIFLSASCLVYWFGGAAVGFCGGVAYALQLCHANSKRRHILLGILGAVVGIGVTLGLTWKISSAVLRGEGASLFPELQQAPAYTVDLGVTTLPIQSIRHIHHTSDWWIILQDSHIPPFVLLLAGLCLFIPFGWKKRWPWAIATLVSLGIPLVPAIQWNGRWLITGQALLQKVFPPLLRCEYPERMMVAPTVLLLFFAALSLSALLNNCPKNVRWGTTGLLTLLCLGPGLHLPKAEDLRVSSFVVDDFYLDVAAQSPGGIIDVPLSRSENLYVQQLFHHQPLLGGPGLNRVQSAEHKQYCDQNTLLRGLESYALTGLEPASWTAGDKKKLIDDGFSVIIFHPSASKVSLTQMETYLGTKGIVHPRTKRAAFPLTSIDP